MGYTERDKIEGKINLKRQELSRKQIKKQLSKNGYGKYTPIEIDMITSEAFLTLNGSCKNLLLLILGKRRLKFKKKKVPVCINSDEIIMTYKELEAPPFNFHPEQIRRNFKILLSRGFIKKVYQGGGFKKDKNIYGISDNWRIWEPEKDFSPKKKDVKRGYQGKGLGAVKNILNTQKCESRHTQKCESKSKI